MPLFKTFGRHVKNFLIYTAQLTLLIGQHDVNSLAIFSMPRLKPVWAQFHIAYREHSSSELKGAHIIMKVLQITIFQMFFSLHVIR